MNDLTVLPEQAKILVVDDDLSYRFLVTTPLAQAGFNIIEADNGVECMDKLSAESPDVIIMDVLMPQMNGYEACEAIRKIEAYQHIPILMMTGGGADDDDAVEAAYQAGATDFISKPFNYNLLVHRIRYMVRSGNATNALVKSQACLAEAQQLAKLAYWELNPQTHKITWSHSLLDILKVDDQEVIGQFDFLLSRIPEEDRKLVEMWFNDACEQVVSKGITHRIKTDDQKMRYIYQYIKSSHNAAGELVELHGTLQDVTEMHEAQERIRNLAFFDTLTGLPNRTYFNEILAQTLRLAARQQRQGALLFIDLDNFKRINDTFGHHSGDQLLAAVTARINSCLRASDLLAAKDQAIQCARLGGDEFTILLPELNKAESAAIVARRILNALATPFSLESNDVVITPSIGITVFPDDAQEAEECLRNADIAMYYAKRKGRNGFCFFNKEMNEEASNRMKLESTLRSALAKDEFTLVYQPQIDVENGKMHGVEALIRWHSEELGFVPPDQFISVAEETGMIIEIGDWVLNEACRQASAWLAEGVDLSRMAVNISTRQFAQANFAEKVAQILEETGLAASKLELEMTESLLMSQAEDAVCMLQALKALGVGLSIDDFGTGYSSLAYLRQFPIDHLKIDKTFIDEVNQDHSNASIVRAVIAMATNMDLRVTAEGVETSDQLDFLKEQLCTEAQGYYFSKPLPPQEIPAFTKLQQA